LFHRQKFVTNSSSTSFIFFGVQFDEVDAEDLFEKIVPPEERSKEAYLDVTDTLCGWADGLKGEIGVYLDWEGLDGVVYIRDTHLGLEERGFDYLPAEQLKDLLTRGKEKEWAKYILAFCEEYGLVPSTRWGRDGKPKWGVALSVNR
jgi:hypothetical protein